MEQYEAPVLLIFFNRPDTFEKVFSVIRQVKPKRLYLFQDGPRTDRPDDIEDMEKCRNIAENIDWECDVQRHYSSENLGCGKGPYTAISWALETTDRIIILEDDCVPDMSFFPYCSELLEKYKDDSRISYISGLNHMETWDCGNNSYCFTKTGAIWGWATWRSEWEINDYDMNAFNSDYVRRLIKFAIKNKYAYDIRKTAWEKAYNAKNTEEKLSYWDMQWGFAKYSQNKLVIVPECNLITNIGIGEKSTHAKKVKSLDYKKGKSMVNIPSHKIETPLVHPDVMICDEDYDELVYKMAQPSISSRLKIFVYRIIERVLKKNGTE